MSKKTANRKEVHFDTDAAIASRREDLLGRNKFADALADAIARSSADHAIVVALNGGWGTGKSSIKNIVVENLKQRDAVKLMEFNPWNFAGEKELAEGFFHDLGLSLGVHEPGAAETKRAAAWNTLAGRLSGGASAVKNVGRLLGMFGVPMAEVIGSTLGDALKESGELSKEAKEQLEEQSKLATKTLSEVRADLTKSLPSLKKPLLVVIDDIDRLTADEVCLLFRLVKANADFPRLIFLLLFDRPQVVRALAGIATGHGDAFLEKIVQVAFDVPDLTPAEVLEFADKELRTLLRHVGVSLSTAEKKRWEVLKLDLAGYFDTLRSVRRFMNSLRFELSLFKNRAGFELNIVDLASLEILRVFENDLYRRLPRFRSMLLAEAPYFPGLDHQKKQAREQYELLLEPVDAGKREAVATALRRIFPYMASGDGIDKDPVTIISRRVAHPEMFDAYFRLTLSEKAIPLDEIQRVRSAASDYTKFKRLIEKYMRRGRFALLLEHLWEYADELSAHAAVVTQVLFDVSDSPPNVSGSWVLDSEGYKLTNFIQELVATGRSIKERADLIIKAVAQAKAVHLPMLIVSGETKYRSDKKPEALLVPETRVDELQNVLGSRLSALAGKAFLTRPTFLPWKLSMWEAAEGVEKPSDWLRSQLSTHKTLITILRAFRDNSQTVDARDRLRTDLISRYVDLPTLQQTIARATAGTSTDEERAFLNQCLQEIRDGSADAAT